MRPKVGVILMEEQDGSIEVQLFSAPEQALDSFKQIHGNPADEPSRATFVSLNYEAGKAGVWTKDLPVTEDRENALDGVRLGDGPVWFNKEDGEGSVSDGRA